MSLQPLLPKARWFSVVSALLLIVLGLQAQTPSAPLLAASQPKDLVVTWDQTVAGNVSLQGTTTLTLHLKNSSTKEIILNHFALNNPAVWVPITPIDLKPAATADFSLGLQGQNLSLPSALTVFFQVSDGTSRVQPIKLASNAVLVVSPLYVSWKVGDVVQTKTVSITNVPSGVTVTGVSSNSTAFVANLSGSTISITPLSTTQAQSGRIAITTSPAGRTRLLISVAVK